MKNIKFLLLLLVINATAQQGGMWIPSMLNALNQSEMTNLGMKMSLSDIYSINKSSLKDAVPHFNGGCTSEVISNQGLLLTNHHCGFDAIQNHSSVEHDYLTNGFWAYSKTDELPNPDLVVTFVISINDVSKQVLDGVDQIVLETEKQKKIQENITKITANFKKESYQENKVRSFFEGNQYLLFVTETFKDIRLVGAPPSSIGKFGSDTDNWVWPRHTGDFSLFRIYANAKNQPAIYNKDNIPYTPKHFLPISLDGVQENDFTLVMGYPGRTQEYLSSFAVNQIVTTLNPAKIEIRDKALQIADGFMRKDNAIKIQYASKYAGIANYWKKWIGETQGLIKSNALKIKQNEEEAFQKNLIKANKQEAYGNLLADLEKNYLEIKPYALSRDYFSEVMIRNTELTALGYKLFQLEQLFISKGEQVFLDKKASILTELSDFYKDFNPEVDQKVFEKLIDIYAKKAPNEFLPNNLKNLDVESASNNLYLESSLGNFEKIKTILDGNSKTVLENLNADPGYLFIKEIASQYNNTVSPKLDELTQKIAALQRSYMKAQLELSQNKRMFPDANSTLRVTYGKVKGYAPKDATLYTSTTYLDGVIEKYIPGDYEFDVPKKLLDLYYSKDYGVYGQNGKMPVCFIGTNHTTGGNSGSPAIDAKGNLIGLNFDRVWEGTMSDIHYDPTICRNVMVDARYILFIIDKFAEAKNIIDELKLVRPKKIKK